MTNNNKISNYKQNLEDRKLEFSKSILRMCNALPKNRINLNLIDQLSRSATSIGANYREANDSLSKKDFLNRIRISRKEAKETSYWLDLIKDSNPGTDIDSLSKETFELRNILSAIITKVSK